jgi:hypothetical protein
VATPCDDPRTAARAHWVLGAFKEASDAWLAAREREPALEPTVSEAQAHSFAGRPLAARDVVRLMSERWYRGPQSPEKLGLECIANAFGRRGGDEAAARALDAAPRSIPECASVAGDFGYQKPGAHAELIDGEPLRRPGDVEFHDPYGVIQYPSAWAHLHPLALEASVLRQLTAPGRGGPEAIEWDGDKIGYGHHAAELAAFLAIMGERERARGYLDLLDRIDRAKPPYPTNRDEFPDIVQADAFRWAKVMAVAAGAAALLSDDARARRYLPRAEAHAKGVVEHHLILVHDGEKDPTFAPLGGSFGGLWWPHEGLFAAASRGDGAELAGKLTADKATGRAVFAEVLPRIHARREALTEWARARFPAPCWTCGLFAVAENAGDRREIARLLGDTALEAKTAAVAQRYVEAILQRDGAPELAELERLYERISGARR